MRSTISSRLVPSLFGPIWAAATFIPRTSIPRTSRGIAIHLLILMRARGFGLTYTDVNVHQSALPGEAPVARRSIPPRVREAARRSPRGCLAPIRGIHPICVSRFGVHLSRGGGDEDRSGSARVAPGLARRRGSGPRTAAAGRPNRRRAQRERAGVPGRLRPGRPLPASAPGGLTGGGRAARRLLARPGRPAPPRPPPAGHHGRPPVPP